MKKYNTKKIIRLWTTITLILIVIAILLVFFGKSEYSTFVYPLF